MLVDCCEGFYVLAFGFTGDAVLADGSVVLEWGGDGRVSSRPVVVEAEGPGTFLSVRFTPDRRLAPAAEALLAHCLRR
jgi:hypothetical protein